MGVFRLTIPVVSCALLIGSVSPSNGTGLVLTRQDGHYVYLWDATSERPPAVTTCSSVFPLMKKLAIMVRSERVRRNTPVNIVDELAPVLRREYRTAGFAGYRRLGVVTVGKEKRSETHLRFSDRRHLACDYSVSP
jgi:hypothetical protein